MAKVDVIAFIDSAGNPRVWPPVARLKKNEDIEVTNFTGEDVLVSFPGNRFDDGAGNLDPNKSHNTLAHKAAKAKKVHANATPGSAAYQVLLLNSKRYAQGNSDPEIIIEN